MQNNKDLDLPTQQELLAQFRCDEIAAVAVSKFLTAGVKDVRKVVERGDVVEGLGAVMAGWKDGAISKIPPYGSFEASVDNGNPQRILTMLPRGIINRSISARGPTCSRTSIQLSTRSSITSSRT